MKSCTASEKRHKMHTEELQRTRIISKGCTIKRNWDCTPMSDGRKPTSFSRSFSHKITSPPSLLSLVSTSPSRNSVNFGGRAKFFLCCLSALCTSCSFSELHIILLLEEVSGGYPVDECARCMSNSMACFGVKTSPVCTGGYAVSCSKSDGNQGYCVVRHHIFVLAVALAQFVSQLVRHVYLACQRGGIKWEGG